MPCTQNAQMMKAMYLNNDEIHNIPHCIVLTNKVYSVEDLQTDKESTLFDFGDFELNKNHEILKV